MAATPLWRRAPEPEIEIVDVTPEMAREWLERNTSNRNIRSRQVAAYAHDMATGQWLFAGEPLKFGPDGTLWDGQHRLAAIILSRVTVPMMVVRNIAPAAQGVMDTGIKRQAADQLHIAGIKNAPLVGSVAKWMVIYERGQLYGDHRTRTVTHTDIVRFVEAHPDLLSITNVVAAHMRRHVDMPGTPLTVAYFICSRVHAAGADEFFERLADGAGLGAGNPLLALRSRLRELKSRHSSLANEHYLSLTIRAWNAWRQGRAMATIPVFKNGAAIRCPEPK